jgi:replicative DNA helicase
MSVGISLVLSVVKEKSRSRLLNIPSEFLRTDDEKRLYEFVRVHVAQHNKFPTINTLRRRFSINAYPDEPSSYYYDEAKRRAFYNLLREPYARLGESFKGSQSDVSAMLAIIDEIASIRRRFGPDSSGVEDSRALLAQILQEFEDSSTYHGLRGVTTGWDAVDDVTGGYQPGDHIVWVGRVGRGKSWSLLYQCYNAWKAGHRILFVSNEMEGRATMRRMVGLHSRINPNLIRTGTVSTASQDLVRRSIAEMNEMQPLFMVTANFDRSVPQVEAYIDQFQPDISYIDAGYLLKPQTKRYGSSGRRETISDVAEDLKKCAADRKIPIVSTMQFNRQAEERRRAAQKRNEEQQAGSTRRFNPIAHLGVEVIGETDVIGQSASHVFGLDLGPHPFEKSVRVFGILKGREGEDGYWYCNYPENRTSPIDLSLLQPDDPRIEIMERPQARSSRSRGNSLAPNPSMLDFMR